MVSKKIGTERFTSLRSGRSIKDMYKLWILGSSVNILERDRAIRIPICTQAAAAVLSEKNKSSAKAMPKTGIVIYNRSFFSSSFSWITSLILVIEGEVTSKVRIRAEVMVIELGFFCILWDLSSFFTELLLFQVKVSSELFA